MESVRGRLHSHSCDVFGHHLCDLRKIDIEAVADVSHLTKDGCSRSTCHNESQNLIAFRQHSRTTVTFLCKRCAHDDVHEYGVACGSRPSGVAKPRPSRWVNDLTHRATGSAPYHLDHHSAPNCQPNPR